MTLLPAVLYYSHRRTAAGDRPAVMAEKCLALVEQDGVDAESLASRFGVTVQTVRRYLVLARKRRTNGASGNTGKHSM